MDVSKRKCSNVQFKAMVQCLRTNPEMLHRTSVSDRAQRTHTNRLWTQLASTLNKIPAGAKKSPDRWKTVWHQFKYNIRQKAKREGPEGLTEDQRFVIRSCAAVDADRPESPHHKGSPKNGEESLNETVDLTRHSNREDKLENKESDGKKTATDRTEFCNVNDYENTVIVTDEAGETITTIKIGDPIGEDCQPQNPHVQAAISTPENMNNVCEEKSYVKFLKDSLDEWEIFGSHVAWECRSIKSKSLRKDLKRRIQEAILEFSKKDNEKRHTDQCSIHQNQKNLNFDAESF